MCISISFSLFLCYGGIFVVFPEVTEVVLIYLMYYGRALQLFPTHIEQLRKLADLTYHKSRGRSRIFLRGGGCTTKEWHVNTTKVYKKAACHLRGGLPLDLLLKSVTRAASEKIRHFLAFHCSDK